jgi:hypothetical protein
VGKFELKRILFGVETIVKIIGEELLLLQGVSMPLSVVLL